MKIIADSTYKNRRVTTIRINGVGERYLDYLKREQFEFSAVKLPFGSWEVTVTSEDPSFLNTEQYYEYLAHAPIETRCHLPFTPIQAISAFYAANPDAVDKDCFNHFASTCHDVFLGEHA